MAFGPSTSQLRGTFSVAVPFSWFLNLTDPATFPFTRTSTEWLASSVTPCRATSRGQLPEAFESSLFSTRVWVMGA